MFANNHAQKSYSLQLLPSQTFIIQNSFLPSVKHFCLRLIKTHDYQNSHLLEDKNKPFKQCLTESVLLARPLQNCLEQCKLSRKHRTA